MTYFPFGGQTYNLQSSISSTATEFTLTSFLEPVTGTPYTMALLNTDIVYGTIAPKTTSSEFISFTGITQNDDGTATISGVTRGLAKKYPFTADTSYRLPHSGQSQFIISDAPQVFRESGALQNDEVITGFWEAPDPISAQGLVTNQYMLDLINGGPITLNALVETGTAGETLVAGDLIYFSETDNEWMKTDADTLATLFNVKLGIAQGSGTNGNPITDGVLTRGSYTTSGLTQGDLCYASNTAGGINSGTPGTVPRVIGIAKSITVLYFDPDFQNRLYDYAVDSVGTDSYAITLAGALSVPFVGMEINFKAGTANTGPCTIALNGGSAKTIVKNVSDPLETGDILANQIIKLVYNGTSFQLVSPGIASATYKGTVEEATGTEFDAGTQTGSQADLFINPSILPGKYVMGVLGNAIPKTYFNIQLPFILWTGSTSAAATTDFANWVRSSSDVEVSPVGIWTNFTGTSTDSIYMDTGSPSNAIIDWTSTNKIVLDFWAKLPATGTGDIVMGFSSDNSDYEAAYTSSTCNRVMFAMSSAGVIYSVIAKAGVGSTQTNISSGITNTVWNNFRIELDLSNNALFYVNGTLKATMSGTNFPTTGSHIFLGYGRSNTALFKLMAPNISLEMNP